MLRLRPQRAKRTADEPASVGDAASGRSRRPPRALIEGAAILVTGLAVHRARMADSFSIDDLLRRGGVASTAAGPFAWWTDVSATALFRLVATFSASGPFGMNLAVLALGAFALTRLEFDDASAPTRPMLPLRAGVAAALLLVSSPVAFGLAATETGRAAFLGFGLVVLAGRRLLAGPGRRRFGLALLGLLIVGLLGPRETASGTRFVLWPELPALDPDSRRLFAASLLIGAVGLVLPALARSRGRRALELLALVLALVLALAARSPAAASVAAALLVGLAVPSIRIGPRSEALAVGLLAFLILTLANLGRHVRLPEAATLAELRRIAAQIDALPAEFDEILVLGLPEAPGGARLLRSGALRGASAPRRRLEALVEGADAELPDDLFSPPLPDLVLDWGPGRWADLGNPEGGYFLQPLVRRPAGGDGGVLRLVAPADGAILPLGRPERIEDDIAFDFEVLRTAYDPGVDPFIFHAFYSGPRGPEGRGDLRARVLEAAALEELDAPAGWRRFRWRPVVRPGPGVDGLRLEDPQRGLADRSLRWTVGLGALGSSESAEEAPSSRGATPDRLRPRCLARGRRVDFVSTRNDR